MKKFFALILSMFYISFYMIYLTCNRVTSGDLISKLVNKNSGIVGIGDKTANKFLQICDYNNFYIVYKPNELATIVAVLAFVTIGYVFFALHQETHIKLDNISESQEEIYDHNVELHEATQSYLIDEAIQQSTEVSYESNVIPEE